MSGIEKFIKSLYQAGIEISESRYSKNYYDTQEDFRCNSLDSQSQSPVFLRMIASDQKLYIALTGELKIIINPINRKINWSELSEDEIQQLAREYISVYENLKSRAIQLMAPI